jgi:hypothetical protein
MNQRRKVGLVIEEGGPVLAEKAVLIGFVGGRSNKLEGGWVQRPKVERGKGSRHLQRRQNLATRGTRECEGRKRELGGRVEKQ